MTLVCFQHPILLVLFALSALTLLVTVLMQCNCFSSFWRNVGFRSSLVVILRIFAGMTASVLFLMGLFYAIPPVEQLLMFLLIVLFSFISMGKEENNKS